MPHACQAVGSLESELQPATRRCVLCQIPAGDAEERRRLHGAAL